MASFNYVPDMQSASLYLYMLMAFNIIIFSLAIPRITQSTPTSIINSTYASEHICWHQLAQLTRVHEACRLHFGAEMYATRLLIARTNAALRFVDQWTAGYIGLGRIHVPVHDPVRMCVFVLHMSALDVFVCCVGALIMAICCCCYDSTVSRPKHDKQVLVLCTTMHTAAPYYPNRHNKTKQQKQ